ncbi:zinc finger protein [Aphelenchoides avenae]|nr:zinc finger protein [Aphelenchus avenae]
MSHHAASGSGAATGPSHRRTWDKTEFEIKAQERIAAEREAADIKSGKIKPPKGPKKEMLKPRDFKVDLESRIGKQVVINKTTPTAETGGYYCDVCDCVVKDSINFLDHINGKNHQRNMGFSMKVKRSTVDEVRDRLQQKKSEKLYSKKEDDQERMQELKEEEAKLQDLKRQQRERQQTRKRPATQEEDLDKDSELYKLMGIGGFGTSKKK